MGFIAKQLHCTQELLRSIDSGHVFADQEDEAKCRSCWTWYPASSSILVCWRRHAEHDDESAKLVGLLADLRADLTDAAGMSGNQVNTGTAMLPQSVRVGIW